MPQGRQSRPPTQYTVFGTLPVGTPSKFATQRPLQGPHCIATLHMSASASHLPCRLYSHSFTRYSRVTGENIFRHLLIAREASSDNRRNADILSWNCGIFPTGTSPWNPSDLDLYKLPQKSYANPRHLESLRAGVRFTAIACQRSLEIRPGVTRQPVTATSTHRAGSEPSRFVLAPPGLRAAPPPAR